MPTPTSASWIMATSLAPSPTESHDVEAVLYHGDDGGFLCGADTAAEHRLALLAQQQELLLQGVAERPPKREAVDDQSVCGGGSLVVFHGLLQLLVTTRHMELCQATVELLFANRQVFRLGRQVSIVFVDLETDKIHVVVQQIAGKANVDGCLDLVAREYPELNPGIAQQPNGIWDAVLKTVFDGSSSQQGQVSFDLIGYLLKLLLAVFQRRGGHVVFFPKLAVLLLRELLLGDAKRPETLNCEQLEMLRRFQPEFGLFTLLEASIDDAVGALAEKNNPAIRHSHNRTHPFPARVELDGIEDGVVLVGAHDVQVDSLA